MASIKRGRLPVDNFTMVDNRWLRDKRLSWKARGLLAWLTSHAVGFQVSLDRIVKASDRDGREAARTAIQELEKLGYLVREKDRDKQGRIVSSSYTLTDPSIVGIPDVGEPDPLRRSPLEEDHSFMPASGDHPSGDQDLPLSRAQRERRAADHVMNLVAAIEADEQIDGWTGNTGWYADDLVTAVIQKLRNDRPQIQNPEAWLAKATRNHKTGVGVASHLLRLLGDEDEYWEQQLEEMGIAL
jgi:hypothetical protein